MKSMARHLCLALIGMLLVAPFPASALDPGKAFSQYMRADWNARTGLPQKTVNSVAQTRDGFLWLATEDGLIRYDGRNFRTFDDRNSPELGDRLIRSLVATPDGGMWIGTMTGLVRYDKGTFTSFRSQSEWESDIYDVGLTGDGDIWFSTMSGLRRLSVARNNQPTRLHVYTVSDGLPSNEITGLAGAPDGTLWIGTRSGLVHFTGNTFAVYPGIEGQKDKNIVSLSAGRHNNIWIGTNDGTIAQWKNGRISIVWKTNLAQRSAIVSLCEDSDGTLWVAFKKMGLGRLRDGNLKLVTQADGLPSIDPDWVFEDREHNLWVGWADAGLSMFRDGKFTVFGKSEGLSSDMISSVTEAPDGGLWIGTADAGLDRLDPDLRPSANAKGESTSLSAAVLNNLPRGTLALLEQRNGTLWVGSDRDAVTRIQSGHVDTFRFPGNRAIGLPAIVEDSHGEPWFGFDVRNGLARLRDGHFEFLQVPGSIRGLSMAPDGSLWIASYLGGLIHYKDGVFRIYTKQDGLSNLFLTSVHVDSEGTVWAGTLLGGLNRLKDGHITRFSVEQGLSDSTVGAVVDDGLGFLWLAGTHGIMRVKLQDLTDFANGQLRSIASQTFDTSDGLRSEECNFVAQPAAWKDRKGRLWFATSAGLAMIDPDRIRINKIAPKAQIEGLFENGRAIASISSEIRIRPGMHDLSIHFAAPSFAASSEMTFRYRLVELSDSWQEGDPKQGATYSNLPPGHYTFELKAANADGVSDGQITTLSFEVLPHYYETWWFRIALFILCAALALLTVVLRTRYLVRKTKRLEELIHEKTSEVRAALESAEAAREMLRDQAMRDALTGMWNRRAIFEILEKEINRCENEKLPLAIIMADLDHFKNINDTWGHQAGDHVIREVSQLIRRHIRREDALGRYGGEELLILLTGMSLEMSMERAESIRAAIALHQFQFGNGVIPVSCSFGLAHMQPGATLGDMVGRADAALYQAKRDGRNCVRLLPN